MSRQQSMTLQCIEDAAFHVRHYEDVVRHYQDALDKLTFEAVDGGIPYRLLAKALGISKSAAFYRVERLLAR